MRNITADKAPLSPPPTVWGGGELFVRLVPGPDSCAEVGAGPSPRRGSRARAGRGRARPRAGRPEAAWGSGPSWGKLVPRAGIDRRMPVARLEHGSPTDKDVRHVARDLADRGDSGLCAQRDLERLDAGARKRLHWSWEVFADHFSGQLYLGDEAPRPRDRLAAVGRRVSTLCKGENGIQQQLALYHVYYNFCLPHANIRHPLLQPEPTHGPGSAKRWQPRTPAMAAGLTDPVWTLR